MHMISIREYIYFTCSITLLHITYYVTFYFTSLYYMFMLFRIKIYILRYMLLDLAEFVVLYHVMLYNLHPGALIFRVMSKAVRDIREYTSYAQGACLGLELWGCRPLDRSIPGVVHERNSRDPAVGSAEGIKKRRMLRQLFYS